MAPHRPRVIFASTVFAEGATGPATYARYLWEAFKDDSDLDFHLLVPKAVEPHPRIHEYGTPTRASEHHRLISNALKLHANDFDIIHSNNAHSIAAVASRAKLLCQINDYEVADAKKNVLQNLRRKGPRKAATLLWRYHQERSCLKNTDLAIANSAYVHEAILREYHLQAKNCMTLYKAVDVAAFERPLAPSTSPWPEHAAGARLLLVGSNWEIKGLDFALEALMNLLPSHPNLHLLVIGSGNDRASQKIRTNFQQLEAQGAVSYVGRKDQAEIARYMWHATLALLPSREEALGVSVLEAMAAGLPVVGSSAGGIREILGDGEFGLQFEPGNIPALTDAIERLLSSASDRQHFAAQSMKRAKDFSREVMLSKLKRIYMNVANVHSRSLE